MRIVEYFKAEKKIAKKLFPKKLTRVEEIFDVFGILFFSSYGGRKKRKPFL